jgi:hypothetical protein
MICSSQRAMLALFTLALNLAGTHAYSAPLALTELSPGDLQITEYLANPAVVSDSANEYFELFNRRDQAIDLEGLIVRDAGSNEFLVTGLVIPARGFRVFSNGDGSGLGIVADYQYGSAMALTNSSDEIQLLGPGNLLLQSLSYDDGDAFGAGVAHELLSGDRVDGVSLGPQAGSDYGPAAAVLTDDNFGSPGRPGTTVFTAPVIPLPPAAWLFGTALAGLSLLRRGSGSIAVD